MVEPGSGFGARSVGFGGVRVSQVYVKFGSCAGPVRDIGAGQVYAKVCVKFALKHRSNSMSGSPGVQGPLNAPGEARSGASKFEPRAAQRASHGGTHSLAIYVRVAWRVKSPRLVLLTFSPRDVGARVSQAHLKLIPSPCQKPTMGHPFVGVRRGIL